MNHATATPSALSMLQSMFPNKMRIGTPALAEVIDWNPISIRNAIHHKKFPIHTYVDGRNRYADLRDVANYLDKKRTPPPKIGRPTKASKLAAQAAHAQ